MPSVLRSEVIEKAHRTDHFAKAKTKDIIARNYYWGGGGVRAREPLEIMDQLPITARHSIHGYSPWSE